MMKKIWDRGSSEKGFTLIELLVVIVILGILAAVAVFAVGGVTDKGKVSACKADVNATETAVEAYYAKIGTYPQSALSGTPASDARFGLITTAPNKFLKAPPGTGSGYTITLPDNNGTVTVAPALCAVP